MLDRATVFQPEEVNFSNADGHLDKTKNKKVFREGPVVIELFAGSGRFTAALKANGVHSAFGVDHKKPKHNCTNNDRRSHDKGWSVVVHDLDGFTQPCRNLCRSALWHMQSCSQYQSSGDPKEYNFWPGALKIPKFPEGFQT